MTRDSREPVRAIAEETQGIIDDVVSGGPSDQFAGLPMAQAALEFASERHAGQYREIDRAPFIAHPIEVGRLLQCDGQPDEVIAAGLLHDVLEKTRTTGPELQRRFGARIARLVESVSDDLSIGDYERRKRRLRARVAHAGPDALAIFAADKIAKVRELALLPPRRHHEPQSRDKLAHYRASLEMLRRAGAGVTLVDLLDPELKRLNAARSPKLTTPKRSRAPRARSTPASRPPK